MKPAHISRTRCALKAPEKVRRTSARKRIATRILYATSLRLSGRSRFSRNHTFANINKLDFATGAPDSQSVDHETKDVVVPQQLWDELFERALAAIDYSHLDLFESALPTQIIHDGNIAAVQSV